MLVGMLWNNRLRPVLLILCLVACGSDDDSDSAVRLGDAWSGESTTSTEEAASISHDAPDVVFLGDSLSAGLHLAEDLAFPAVLQRRLAGRGLGFQLLNAGVSGDTSAGGLARVDWILRQLPDVVVVELGANDGLRGVEVDAIEANLRGILERLQAQDVLPILLGVQLPSSYGARYTKDFRQLYVRLAEDLDVLFVPNFLEGVGGMPRLNLPDGMHPNARGHERLADNIEDVLAGALRELAGDRE